MAEVKNSFLSSKMNKDLDDRLVPSSEYRDALNIEVGKSETNNIGVLQNVYGNERMPLTTNTEYIPGTTTINPNYIPGLECIGAFMDNQNNRIFQFLTDYEDEIPNEITYPPEGKTMRIVVYNLSDPVSYVTLVEGLFLNFAKNTQFRITGVNLVEELLFWTDNRNQPRKININLANPSGFIVPTYYTAEQQISVAKYAPVEPITMYRKITAIVEDASLNPVIVLEGEISVVPGMTLISQDISGTDYVIVVDSVIDTIAGTTTITLYEETPVPINDGEQLTFLISTMSDKSSVNTWPGDPAFLEDKYVRFSYRFKYDDNEYSLMAPFTQLAYVPKQKGYFIAGNETDAYRSTVLSWFENNINNIELIVPFPDRIGNLLNSYKIVEVDILYRESNSIAVKVFETVPISAINTEINAPNNYYIQPYQSQKPYKTLSEDQTVRVYDKVPVRAKAQESAGGRIIYGNYYDKYTSLSSINYNISIQPKSGNGTNFIEYPNHTLKKNRNYQVGFILADKFGRQSPVILSTADVTSPNIGGNNFAKGSTIYSSYENTLLFQDVRTWFGDALILYLNTPIEQSRYIPSGTPGLYAIPTSNFGFAIAALTVVAPKEYSFTMNLGELASQVVPEVGNILRGKYVDYVEVLTSEKTYLIPGDPTSPIQSVTITTSDDINDIYNYTDQGGGAPDIKFAYDYNPIGWYSYKIVVKQQEQDYYNVYLPGMLNGYPKSQTFGSQVVYSSTGSPSLENGINITQFPVSETGNTAHIVLINDNISKVPGDLSEVGPDRRQYRSSVQLYGRVQNAAATVNIEGNTPLFSAKVTTIEYSIASGANPGWELIKPGDGIQCDEANEPIDNTPPLGGTEPNPYRWLGNTVVVSNVISGTTGTITISSPNWVVLAAQSPNTPPVDYTHFTITRAENEQYFPTRKADTVIAIASASEFNFLDSSQTNLSGTAGLNFYQLQTRPIIGRISTINDIGVVANSMVPFLSVYETRPEQSLLELFWETTTTGLISDLNADVLTGFDGPAGFGEFEYIHYEHQNPEGTDPVTGDADSKYITNEFYVVDQTGFPISNTTIDLLSVTDNALPTANPFRISDFGIERITTGPDVTYRLFIKNPLVFNNNAGDLERYQFEFRVTAIGSPGFPDIESILTATGRLWNSTPIITVPSATAFYNITQDVTDIVTLEAINGAYFDPLDPALPNPPDRVKTGLKWSIVGGNTGDYFKIGEYSGALSLDDSTVPLGIYDLTIRVQDAVNTSGPNGPILPIENTNTGTKSADRIITINVGDDPVPFWLRPNFTSPTLSNPLGCAPIPPADGPVYGMVYIGPEELLTSEYVPEIPGMPIDPITGPEYRFITNVEVKNAQDYYGPEYAGIAADGLTQGEYRFNITLTVPPAELCPPIEQGNVKAFGNIYLYRRSYPPSSESLWEEIPSENNWGISPDSYTLGQLVASTILDPDTGNIILGNTQALTTSLTIEADPENFYEYALGIKLTQDNANIKFSQAQMIVKGNDANYSYGAYPFSPPITTAYRYYTGIDYLGATSSVPRTNQNALAGLDFSYAGTVGFGVINPGAESVVIQLSSYNEQIVPGLSFTFTSEPPGTTFVGEVAAVNLSVPTNGIALALDVPFAGATTTSLVGGDISFTTNIPFIDPSPIFPGVLYANTEEGTEIKRFYKDAAFTQKWIPPVADRYYNFITEKDYNPGNAAFAGGALRYTKYPYYCAEFDENGEVKDQVIPDPNSQTAWQGQNQANTPPPLDINNYSYNLYYESTPN